jgi:hypothetical protein
VQLRQIAPPRVVLAPTGLRIRTRLRVSEHDAVVLRSLGAHLGRLANIDLMVRCQVGPDHDKHHWAARKRALTAESSSRWAGAITKRSNDEWATAWQSQTRHAASLRRAIRTLEQRLARPVGSHGTRRTTAGYRSQAERHEKQRRLQILRAKLDRLDAELHMGRLKIVRRSSMADTASSAPVTTWTPRSSARPNGGNAGRRPGGFFKPMARRTRAGAIPPSGSIPPGTWISPCLLRWAISQIGRVAGTGCRGWHGSSIAGRTGPRRSPSEPSPMPSGSIRSGVAGTWTPLGPRHRHRR